MRNSNACTRHQHTRPLHSYLWITYGTDDLPFEILLAFTRDDPSVVVLSKLQRLLVGGAPLLTGYRMPNSKRKNFNSLEAQELYCSSKMEALVDQFGYHACVEALNGIGARPAPSTKRAGRPTEFDYGKYMELWLYVEEGRARLGLSVQAFCKNAKAEFAWFVGGVPQDHSDYEKPLSKIIKGDTLRRRHIEAVALLKADTDLRASRSTAQDAFPGVQEHSFAMIWNEELQQRLARASG